MTGTTQLTKRLRDVIGTAALRIWGTTTASPRGVELTAEQVRDFADVYSTGEVDAAITAIELTPGPAGPPGQDGANGTNGTNGQDGLSAYEVAVANGFVGTEAAWLASLVGADGQDGANGTNGQDGATGATGPAGPNTVTTTTTTNLTGLLEGDGTSVVARAIGVAAATSIPTRDDADARYASRTAPYPLQFALSPVGGLISSGPKKAAGRVPIAGNITAVHIACSPSDEPTAVDVEVDVNKVNKANGTATSILSTVATIAINANEGSGTVNGTQAVVVGDWLQFDVDQGSDGALLTVTVIITPT